MLATQTAKVCSKEQHDDLLQLVRKGKLFELMDWVESGKPTLIRDINNIRKSLITEAGRQGHHSIVVFLWEKAYQYQWELDSLMSYVTWANSPAAGDIVKYLIQQGLSVENLRAAPIFKTHDDELIYLALKKGLDVRGDDGFADALLSTGCSKHLLRLYRELKDEYPDLEYEAHIALRSAVESGKLRASALLVWAGVDPWFEFPNPPYGNPQYCKYSAFSRINLNDETLEMLKAMKIKMTADVWFYFFDRAVWLDPKFSFEVFKWVPDAEKLLRNNPEKSAKVFKSAIRNCAPWRDSYRKVALEKLGLTIAEYMVNLGIPCLHGLEDKNSYKSLRDDCYGASQTKHLVKVLWLVYERGDANQRAKLKELVRMPKMQSIIRDHDPQLVRDLGIGTKRQLEFRTDSKHRAWRMEEYSPPSVFDMAGHC